jgi:hypothetical protein
MKRPSQCGGDFKIIQSRTPKLEFQPVKAVGALMLVISLGQVLTFFMAIWLLL